VSEPIEEPVPKLPRGRGLKFSGPEMFRILLTLVTLIGVLVLARPCANAVSGFVTSFDGSETEKQMPKPGNVDVPAPQQEMELLRPDMTEAEMKAAIERSKARAAAASGSAATGSAATGSAATGSAATGNAGSSEAATKGPGPAPSGSAASSTPKL
jgi:hypothetical protein